MTDAFNITPEDFSREDITKIIMNPFNAINISEGLCGKHEPIVTEEQWIKCNAIAIQEQGAEKWLKELLNILKGGYKAHEE